MGSKVTLVRMLVPGSSQDPIELDVRHSGLRMNLVDRESIHALPHSWKEKGIYFLFGPGKEASSFCVYVGMAAIGTSSVVGRIRDHDKKKDWWNRALLVAHEANGFNGSEIGYLEGRFWNVLQNAVAAEVTNHNEPGDDTLTSAEEDALERYVPPVMAALRAAGYSPDTIDQKSIKVAKTKRKYYGESVKDLIDAGFLAPDTKLESTRTGVTAKATVQPDGTLLVNGKAFHAVSPAAIEASGNQSEPGWDFWGAPSGTGELVSLFELRELYRDSSESAKAEAAPPSESSPPSKKGSHTPKDIKPKRSTVTIKQLLDAELLKDGETLTPKSASQKHRTATVSKDGSISFEGSTFTSPSTAAKILLGYPVAGWGVWTVQRAGKPVLIDVLRKVLDSEL